jgi:glycerol-3-phosphate dehydrogenase
MTHVAEGVATTAAAHKLAKDQGLGLPIISLIYGILFEGLPPSRVLSKFKGLVAGQRSSGLSV